MNSLMNFKEFDEFINELCTENDQHQTQNAVFSMAARTSMSMSMRFEYGRILETLFEYEIWVASSKSP